MAVGSEVNASVINSRSADAVLSLRLAFAKVQTIAKWLANNPNDPVAGDPLVNQYGYNADEAYLIRYTFETLENIRVTNADTLETARKLTGLEWT